MAKEFVKLTKAQKRTVEAMRSGHRLWLFGDNGFELHAEGEFSWPQRPQKRTVDILIDKGILQWMPYKNDTQRECGIIELELI